MNLTEEARRKGHAAFKAARAALKAMPPGDFPDNCVPGKLKLCSWECNRTTRNISEICDSCWRDREKILKARKEADSRGVNSEQGLTVSVAMAPDIAEPTLSLKA